MFDQKRISQKLFLGLLCLCIKVRIVCGAIKLAHYCEFVMIHEGYFWACDVANLIICSMTTSISVQAKENI